MKIPYKCLNKKDLDVLFKQHKLDKWLYESLEKYGSVNVFINTETDVYSWCKGYCKSCEVKKTCDSVDILFINPTNELRETKLKRINYEQTNL